MLLISETAGASMPFTVSHVNRLSNGEAAGGPCSCEIKTEKQEETTMSKKEMSDNITFIAALEMLEQLENQELLTPAEVEKTKAELKRRLRPTLIFV